MESRYPWIERSCMIEIPAPRRGRPGYRWVQGWIVRYSPDRTSMPMRRYEAINAMREARDNPTQKA